MDNYIENQNHVVNKAWNPKIFMGIIISLHVLGAILFLIAIIMAGVNGRIVYNDTDVVVFTKPIDFLIYFFAIMGTFLLAAMGVYWAVYYKMRKVIGDEKRDLKFDESKWKKYRHMINASKVGKSKPKKVKKNKG